MSEAQSMAAKERYRRTPWRACPTSKSKGEAGTPDGEGPGGGVS